MRIPVISSKAAQNDNNKIVASHADLVAGIANQTQKVQQYNQQKQQEMAQKQAMDSQMKMQQMNNNTQVQKQNQDFAIKQGQLDVQRASLSNV